MAHLLRPRRSSVGRSRLDPSLGTWLIAGPLAVALGCSPAAPPETPASVEPSAAESAEVPEVGAEAEPAASDPAAGASDATSEQATSSSAGSSAAGAPARDSRGKQEIQQVMSNNRDKVRACYDAALAQNPGIKGDLVVDFTIDPRGDVKQAEVNWSQSEIHIPELDTCAADAIRSLKFPPSSRGLESKVSYPFNFNPPRPGSPEQPHSGPEPSRK